VTFGGLDIKLPVNNKT